MENKTERCRTAVSLYFNWIISAQRADFDVYREHIATCPRCKQWLDASNKTPANPTAEVPDDRSS